MRGNRKYPIISFTPGFYIILAFCVLTLPLRWIIGWMAAAAVHELGHYIALRCCRYPISNVQIGAMGARMATCALTPKAELLSALAGPLAGGILVIFMKPFPILGICALIQTLSNLLPIHPLDGGRVVLNMLRIFLPNRLSEFLFMCIRVFVSSALLTIVCCVFVRLHCVSMLLVLVIIVTIRFCMTKSSCKEVATAVQ